MPASSRSEAMLRRQSPDELNIKLPELNSETERVRINSQRVGVEKQFAVPLNIKPTMTIRGLDRVRMKSGRADSRESNSRDRRFTIAENLEKREEV